MRRTGNISLVPTIGSIGWATVKTVREPVPADAGAAVAQPASAATAAALPVDNTFLRSMTSVSLVR